MIDHLPWATVLKDEIQDVCRIVPPERKVVAPLLEGAIEPASGFVDSTVTCRRTGQDRNLQQYKEC